MKSRILLIITVNITLSLLTFTTLSTEQSESKNQQHTKGAVDKKSTFEKDVEKYLTYKNHKAYAMAFGEKSGWVSGYGYNYATQEKADERALHECQKQKETKGIEGLCYIRARGNRSPEMPWGSNSYTGCDDPKYVNYIASRLEGFESREKQSYEEALQKLEESPYDSLSDLDKLSYVRQNTVYSARFDTVEVALENIQRLNSGLIDSKFHFRKNGDILHETNIAKAWLALREGNIQQAIHFLLQSTRTKGSPMLDSFGPDKSLIRELYTMGQKNAVLEYLEKTDKFWNNESAMKKKATWRVMINNNCPIQFQFYDVTNFDTLGLQIN